MVSFRERYGAAPLHLLAVMASFAIAAYAFLEIFDRPNAFNTLIWFGGAVVAHDLIAFPLYSLFGVVAGRAMIGADEGPSPARISALNHVRVPVLLSAFAFIAWFPLILGLSDEKFVEKTGMTESVYLGRWLLLTAVLLTASALLYAVRLRLARPG